MAEECREQIYSEEYLDYLVEVLPDEIENDTRNLQYCYQLASYRFAVLYERGREYMIGPESGIKIIPHCYGLLSSDQVLENTGVSQARRQSGLNLYGQGVLVGFVDTGIDYSHPAFIGSDGRTRILTIWDQTVENPREGEKLLNYFLMGWNIHQRILTGR